MMLARDTGKGEVLSAAPVAEQEGNVGAIHEAIRDEIGIALLRKRARPSRPEQDGGIAPAQFTISIEARGLDRAEPWPAIGR